MGKIVEKFHLENLSDLIADLNRGIGKVLERRHGREYWSNRFNDNILHLNNIKNDAIAVQVTPDGPPVAIDSDFILDAVTQQSKKDRANMAELEQQQLDEVLKGIATLAECAKKIAELRYSLAMGFPLQRLDVLCTDLETQ